MFLFSPIGQPEEIHFRRGDKVLITGMQRKGEVGMYHYIKDTFMGPMALVEFEDKAKHLYSVDEFVKLSVNL